MEFHALRAALVVGIGNTDRGDDGAGIVAARYIRAKMSSRIPVIEQSGEGTDLIDLWQTMNLPIVYLIDTMFCGLPPGTIQRFDAHDTPLPAQCVGDYSTHSFGLIEAIELARVLGCMPPQVIVYGIEGQCFGLGEFLSVEVEAAAYKTAELIITELSQVADNHIIGEVTV